MPHYPPPTEAELQVLRVLWREGPCTAGEVHEALYGGGDAGYTAALKLLQNALAKGLVSRDESRRPHRYTAAVPEAETMHSMLRRLIDRTFDGSAAALAMHALGAKPSSADELRELKALVRRLESQQGDS